MADATLGSVQKCLILNGLSRPASLVPGQLPSSSKLIGWDQLPPGHSLQAHWLPQRHLRMTQRGYESSHTHLQLRRNLTASNLLPSDSAASRGINPQTTRASSLFPPSCTVPTKAACSRRFMSVLWVADRAL